MCLCERSEAISSSSAYNECAEIATSSRLIGTPRNDIGEALNDDS
jgi:hypothetical protein